MRRVPLSSIAVAWAGLSWHEEERFGLARQVRNEENAIALIDEVFAEEQLTANERGFAVSS